MYKLSTEEKRILAGTVIAYIANLAEIWEDQKESGYCPDELKHLTSEQVANQLALWMDRLPGDQWDTRLPYPDEAREKNKRQ